jgi:hypothetical protein
MLAPLLPSPQNPVSSTARAAMRPTIEISINEGLVDKLEAADKRRWSHGFIQHELCTDELAKVISEFGYAFSYVFENETRKTENFRAANFLAVDIDGGQTIEDALKNPMVAKYCSILYTTPSHSPKQHRFRLVFVLHKSITDPDDLKAASISLARRCGGDLSATDAARMFFGSRNCKTLLLNHQLDEVTLSSLIRDGRVRVISDSIAHPTRRVTCRSQLGIPRHQEFTTTAQKSIRIENVASKVAVHCPYHDDQHASAFIAVSPQGGTFFRCSACQLTRFMEGTESSYDFDSFEKAMLRLRSAKQAPEDTTEYTVFQSLAKDFDFRRTAMSQGLHFSNDQYLRLDTIHEGITCIRSPKGSGKTHYLAKAVGPTLESRQRFKTLEDLENADVEGDALDYPKSTVLLIGHRQALIRDMSKRLHLHCYLNDPTVRRIDHDGKLTEHSAPSRIELARYGVCLDSIGRVFPRGGAASTSKEAIPHYDVILIDESEQVLAHFLSDTIGEDRYKLFEQFKNLLSAAGSVVALDADLGWTTVNTLLAIKSLPKLKVGRTGKTLIHPAPTKQPLNIYINSWHPRGREIMTYPTAGQVLEVLKSNLLDGHRSFFVSNSKARVKAVSEAIEELGKRAGRKFRTITITAENSKTVDVQRFITAVRTEILKYDVVLTSPSLGTGVDITFADGGQMIHSVFGIFENLINTHTEIDQQLGRVRNPKHVHVYVSGMTCDFETELLVNREEFLENNFHCQTYTGNTLFREEEQIQRHPIEGSPNEPSRNYFRDHPMMIMIAHILSFQRASKNRLRQNFISYKQRSGWKATPVIYDEQKSESGRNFFKLGKRLTNQKEIDAVVNAAAFTEDQIDSISERLESNFATVSISEKHGLWKDRIARFYGRKVDAYLVKLDDKSRFRERLRNFEAVSSPSYIKKLIQEKKSYTKDKKGRMDQKVRELMSPSFHSRQILLYELLAHTPYFKLGKFDPNVTFNTEDCVGFAKFTKGQRKFVATQLGLAVPRDIERKPIQMMRQVIKMVGLTHWRYRPQVINGKKIYKYRVCPETLQRNQELCRTRATAFTKSQSKHVHSTPYEMPIFGRSGDLGSSVIAGKLVDL